jgi:hypothetical protein
MTFAALTLQVSGGSGGGGGGGGALTNVTTGVGLSSSKVNDYTWWGWLQTPNFGAIYGPSSAIGSSTPTNPTLRGYPVVGVYAGDGGSGGSSAYTYTVAVAGSATTGLVNSLTIDSTAIGASTLVTIATYQPYYTLFRFTLTTPGTNLFGTSGSHTVTIA